MYNPLRTPKTDTPWFAASRAWTVSSWPGRHGRATCLAFAWVGLLFSEPACGESDESSSKDRSEICQKDCERSVNCEEEVDDPEAELRLCTKECIEYLDQSEKQDGRFCVEAREDFIRCLTTLEGCGDFDESHPCQKKLEKEMQLCPDASEPDQKED